MNEMFTSFLSAGAWALIKSILLLIIAALAVAFAISFGIGGRDFAGRMLRTWSAYE